MSLLKSLHDSLFDDASSPKQVDAVPPPVATAPAHSAAAPPAFSFPYPATAPAAIPSPATPLDPEMTERMRQKMMLPAAAAADQFRKILEPLAKSIADEGTRYRTALEIAATQGIDLSKLQGAYTAMLSTLDTEAQHFAAFAERLTATEVAAREQQAAALNAQIGARQQEIVAALAQRDSIEGEVAAQKAKIEMAQHNFAAVYSAFKSDIQLSINKAQTYLQGVAK